MVSSVLVISGLLERWVIQYDFGKKLGDLDKAASIFRLLAGSCDGFEEGFYARVCVWA